MIDFDLFLYVKSTPSVLLFVTEYSVQYAGCHIIIIASTAISRF